MRNLTRKIRDCRALTIMELVMAMAIITIVFAAVLSQFRAISNSWDSKQGNAELLQNGRVLMEHMSRNLSKAVKINAVSDPCETNGFIEFEDNDGNNLRYDISAGYIEFGPAGNLSDLAGPVSSLQFTCYDDGDDYDFGTSITDGNFIRLVNVHATLTNSASMAQDKTFSTSVYLRSNQSTECELVGWWKLDETSGTTAADSSGNGNDGTLTNMAGNEWTTGTVGGALELDGFNDYVQTTSNESKTSTSFTWACWFKADTTTGQHLLIWEGKAAENGWGGSAANTHEAHVNVGTYDMDNVVGCFYGTNESAAEPGVIRIDTSFTDTTNWHHVAFVVTNADSSPSGELFLDGVSVGTDTGDQTGRTDWDTNLRIGRPGTNERYFDGTIDDVRVYNRALDVNEIAQLANTISYEAFTEAKVSSDDTSITIPTPGGSTVSTLGSWTSGLTHTVESGSNRLLVFTAHAEDDAAIGLTSVTYGGQPMTKVIEEVVSGGSPTTYYAYVVAYVLDEAGINAATSDTFVPTWSGSPYDVSYASVFLSNVDQADPIGASDDNSTTTATPNPITTSDLSTTNGDMVIVAATCGDAGDYTVNNDFTEAVELDMASSVGVAGYKAATGENETPSVTHSGPNRQIIIGFVVQSGSISSIEGDLLIAAVATDGDTSSSLAPPGGEGWTEIDVDNYGGQVTLGAWWKLADASESASHQFSWTGDEQAYGWIMRFTGHDPTDPINDWSAGGDSSSTPASPEVTTTLDNCLILRLGAFDDDDITIDDPGLSGHTAITMNESASNGSGMVSILGSWATGTTHTEEAGSDRALIFIAHWEDNVAPSLTVTYGGQTMTKVIDITAGASSFRNYVAAFILDEAGITAATGDTFVPTWGDPPSSVTYASVFLQNVDQADIIGATDSASTTSGTNPIETGPLSTEDGDMVIVAAVCGNNGSYTLNNGFTEGTDQSVGSNGHTGVTGHKAATGADETPSATHTDANRQAIIGFVVQSGSSNDTVSGGAGYVMQTSSGDSGTSDFTLNSANEAQMITIAIAPDVSEDLDACGNSIRP